MLPKETSRLANVSEASSSDQTMLAHIVAGNDELLTEILKHVPVISLLRFKSVSKHWLSLITSPHFSHLQKPNPSLPSGFFLPSLDKNVDFVPLDGKHPIKSPFERFSSAPELSGFSILSSCNGLLCCGRLRSRTASNYYVYNPSNQKFATIPRPSGEYIIGVHLAFDPSKSPLYKVICVVLISERSSSRRVRIEIYSSETRAWKVSVETFNECFGTNFDGGVYFNGAIHWISQSLSTYYFNVDQERIKVMPMPPFPHELESAVRKPSYFGESSGHLHLIDTYGPIELQFDVFEMERDCSGWFVRYHVDLDAIVNTYPEMVLDKFALVGRLYYICSPLYLLEAERKEDSYVVLRIPGKVIRYNFVD